MHPEPLTSPFLSLGRLRARLMWATDLRWTQRVASPKTGGIRQVHVVAGVHVVDPLPSDQRCRLLCVFIGPLVIEAAVLPKER